MPLPDSGHRTLLHTRNIEMRGYRRDDGLFEIMQAKQAAPLTGVHVALRVKSRTDVDEFYRAALAAGGRDNGAPGPRPQYTPNYYACFVLDPDGYNIEAMIDEVR